MAKIYGLFGSMTGKTADVVMAVRNGVQIVRKYQPNVANPSTPAQTAARARLKLMSQLSTVMAPAIAIPRKGNVSARNLFTKLNYGASLYENNEASINMESVQLTKSVVGLPQVVASRTEDGIRAYLPLVQGFQSLSRVVYVAIAKQADGTLRYAGSQVVSTAGTGNFEAQFPSISEEVVIYTYGVRDNTDAARAIFGNLEAITAEKVAKLIVTRQVLESDITVTETQAATVAAAV